MLSAGAVALSSHDVRALLRLSAEVRELGHEPETWRRHLLTELGRLCGGSTGIAFEHWTPRGVTIDHLNQRWQNFAFADAPTAPTVHAIFNAQTVNVGFESERAHQRYDELCYKPFAISDPAWPAINGLFRRLAAAPEGITVASQEVVDASTWSRSSFIQENMRVCDSGPYIRSIQFLHTAHGLLGLNVQRPWGDKPFTEREVALVDLAHSEIARSLRQGPLVAAGLPRRQRQTLELLLGGKREKEVADLLGLSPGTTHGYVKALYRRLGVSSRAELSALFFDAGRRAAPRLVGPAPL